MIGKNYSIPIKRKRMEIILNFLNCLNNLLFLCESIKLFFNDFLNDFIDFYKSLTEN